MASRQSRFDTANRKKEEPEELLVFGYSCKLFRDDEKALFIDQGKHLIPWMGDESLTIDRYDVRGTVADLKPLEPLPGGAIEAQWSALSDNEKKAEQLCDEERYRALHLNEAEEALHQEEELKRLHQALGSQHSYGQVAYNYDDADNSEHQTEEQQTASSTADAEEDDMPFVPPAELDIPVGMVLPEKCKLNAIIEKTALFISTQGPQMEIILKTKQANNPQFEFLSFDCPLHSYYRHLLMAIKTGRYKPQEQNQKEHQESDTDDHYLHPSLAPTPARVELAPSIPSINYKPSADCAYSLLVSKIKDKQLTYAETSGPSSPQLSAASLRSNTLRRKVGSSVSSRSSSRSSSSSNDTSSDSESEAENSNEGGTATPTMVTPPTEIQLIVDKMASYVIKNGRDFEAVVRSKGDTRFGFLDASHEYHPYYEHKIRVYQGIEPACSPANLVPSSRSKRQKKKKKKKEKPKLLLLPQYQSSSSDSDGDPSRKDSSKRKVSKVQAPVSFSIKKPKEPEILHEIRSALPLDLEESSEEDEENKEKSEDRKEKESGDIRNSSRSSKTEESKNQEKEKEEYRKTQRMLKEKELQLREMERKRNEAIFPVSDVQGKDDRRLSDRREERRYGSERKEDRKYSFERKEERRRTPEEREDRKQLPEKKEERKQLPEKREERKQPLEKKEERKQPLEKKEERKQPLEKKEERKQPLEKREERKQPLEKREERKQPLEKREERKQPSEKKEDRNQPSEKKEERKQLSDQLVDLMNSVKQEKNDTIDIDDDDLIRDAEIIDLTDDKVVVPKEKESDLRLERKRKAAAFINRIKKNHQASSNGSCKESMDTDLSIPSPPSPPRLTDSNGSIAPKHSLLARLAASNVVSKQPTSIPVERKPRRRRSTTPKKRSRSRSSSSSRQSKRDKKHKRKRKYDSPERERDYDKLRSLSRSRSRSVMSPSVPHQRRHRDYVPEHRFNSNDHDWKDASTSRHKCRKHKPSKHKRDNRIVDIDEDGELTAISKHKYKHHSKNGQSSDTSDE